MIDVPAIPVGQEIAYAARRDVLTLLEQARRYLAKAVKLDDVKDIRDKTSALLNYLKQKHDASKESLEYAQEIKTRAEIRIGKMLCELKGQMTKKELLNVALQNGISKSQAHSWLSLARELGDYDEAAIKQVTNGSRTIKVETLLEAVRPHQDFRMVEFNGDEWYSPNWIVDAARAVMGTIELDPSSCEEAQQTVKAAHYFSKKDDGLVHKWCGNVYFAPPYSRSLIARFVSKLILEVNAGNVPQAVGIVHSSTDSRWYQDLVENCSILCFPKNRIGFKRHTNEYMETPGGQTIFYFGDAVPAFVSQFGGVGVLLKRERLTSPTAKQWSPGPCLRL